MIHGAIKTVAGRLARLGKGLGKRGAQ